MGFERAGSRTARGGQWSRRGARGWRFLQRVCFHISPQIACFPESHWLHLIDFSPLCIFTYAGTLELRTKVCGAEGEAGDSPTNLMRLEICRTLET